MKYQEVKEKIEAESQLSPGKRTQQIPCAYCERGGNGDKSCGCGWNRTRYSKFEGCFSGNLLDHDPKGR